MNFLRDAFPFAFAVGAAILVGLFLAIIQPGTSGVVASIRIADGSEYLVTQRCNWSPEPYTVSFYMRSSDGPWGWCYIDHQANRWKDVEIRYDSTTNTATITERGVIRGKLDRSDGTFWIDNGSFRRTVNAPQRLSEPDL